MSQDQVHMILEARLVYTSQYIVSFCKDGNDNMFIFTSYSIIAQTGRPQ